MAAVSLCADVLLPALEGAGVGLDALGALAECPAMPSCLAGLMGA